MKVIKYLFCFLLIAHNSEAQNIQIPDDPSLSMCNWFVLSYPELEKSDNVLLVSTQACHEMQKPLTTYEQTFNRLDSQLSTPPDAPVEEVISGLIKYYPPVMSYNLLTQVIHTLTEDTSDKKSDHIEFVENELSDLVYAIAPENLFSSEKIFSLASSLGHNETLKIPGFPNGNNVYDCRYNAYSRAGRGQNVVTCKTVVEGVDDLVTISGSLGSPVMKVPSLDVIEGISFDDYLNQIIANQLSLEVAGVVSSITLGPEPEEASSKELLTHMVDNVFPDGNDSSKSNKYLYVHFTPLIGLDVCDNCNRKLKDISSSQKP